MPARSLGRLLHVGFVLAMTLDEPDVSIFLVLVRLYTYLYVGSGGVSFVGVGSPLMAGL